MAPSMISAQTECAPLSFPQTETSKHGDLKYSGSSLLLDGTFGGLELASVCCDFLPFCKVSMAHSCARLVLNY